MSLLNENLYPITSRFAFIQTNINDVVEEFLNWKTPLVAAHNNSFVKLLPAKDLKSTLLSLCPLTVVELRRFLFIPTKNNWTMILDSSHMGTDRTIPEVLSEFLHAHMIYVAIGPYGNLFEMYNSGNLVRFIGVAKEGKWKFYDEGIRQDFEKTEFYTKRIIKERLTSAMIVEYLRHFEIDLSDNSLDAYSAILVSKKGPMFNATKELSLIEAQNFFR